MLRTVRSSEKTTPAGRSEADTVLRFHLSERQLHWAIAIPFLVCYSTAGILVAVYNPHPGLPFRRVVSLVHRTSGVCLFALPLWTAIRHRRDLALYLHNVRQVWSWTLDDVRWLMLIGPASLSRKIGLPHQGKFNAGEKINFVTLTCTYPLYIFTGLIIWFGGVPYLSWLVHFSLAVIATPLVLGHILMATVNPDTRPGLTGMISGLVDREWARHHYHHWYHEHYGDRAGVPEAAVAVAPDERGCEPARGPARPLAAPSWVRVRGSALGAALFARGDLAPSARIGVDVPRKPRGPRAVAAGLDADVGGEMDASPAS